MKKLLLLLLTSTGILASGIGGDVAVCSNNVYMFEYVQLYGDSPETHSGSISEIIDYIVEPIKSYDLELHENILQKSLNLHDSIEHNNETVRVSNFTLNNSYDEGYFKLPSGCIKEQVAELVEPSIIDKTEVKLNSSLYESMSDYQRGLMIVHLTLLKEISIISGNTSLSTREFLMSLMDRSFLSLTQEEYIKLHQDLNISLAIKLKNLEFSHDNSFEFSGGKLSQINKTQFSTLLYFPSSKDHPISPEMITLDNNVATQMVVHPAHLYLKSPEIDRYQGQTVIFQKSVASNLKAYAARNRSYLGEDIHYKVYAPKALFSKSDTKYLVRNLARVDLANNKMIITNACEFEIAKLMGFKLSAHSPYKRTHQLYFVKEDDKCDKSLNITDAKFSN